MECSQQWEKLCCGTPPFYRISESVHSGLLVHPEDCSVVERIAARWLAGEQYIEAELRLRAPDGNYRWRRVRGCAELIPGSGTQVTAVLSDIDEQTRELSRLRQRAERDTLTGVFNRGTAEERIERALAESGNHTLMLIDLDRFKQVNDRWGHACGDRLLIEAAGRLQRHFRAHDIIGRIGGDEFVVLLRDAAERDLIERKAHGLVEVMRGIVGDDCQCDTSCSVGVARAPHDAHNYTELMLCADEALYTAKRSGRGCVVFYGKQDPHGEA
ncbi:MAG: hypothetical protein ABT01_00905 [Clostridium sp. SCN 57-10]|nr:MAG: hypothetical protein ABT01_00905 [Clostridium sp. SCN 57-10]